MLRTQLEEQYRLVQELVARRAEDPLLTWEPHTKQREVIASIMGSECYENWALWANRAGKTDLGAYCGSKFARFGIPEAEIKPAIGPSGISVWDRATSGWVSGVTSNFVRDVIAPKYFDNGFVPAGSSHRPFIPDREIQEWRPGDRILKLKNGSIIGFKSYADGRSTFQGAGRDWVHFDEEPPQDIYEEVSLRVEAGRRLRIFGTCTLLPPEGEIGGVTWVYTERVKPIFDGKPIGARIFQASIYDNPHLAPAEIARLEALYPEGSVERRIRLDGDLIPGLTGARAYGAFEYSMHVHDPGPIEPRRPLCFCLDFNVEPMVGIVGQRSGRVFKVVNEIILPQGSVMEIGKRFRQEYPTHRAELWIYGDSTGHHRDAGTGKSDYQLLTNEFRGYATPWRLKVPDANPRIPDRINAVNRALKDEFGELGVEIHPKCVELIADLEGVLRDAKGGIKKTFNKSDPYIKRTHTSDAFGYWIAYEQPVTSEPIGQMRREVQTSRNHNLRMKLPGYGKR